MKNETLILQIAKLDDLREELPSRIPGGGIVPRALIGAEMLSQEPPLSGG